MSELTSPVAQPIELFRPVPRQKAGGAAQRWPVDAVAALFELPFNDLIFRAQQVHREHFDANEVQLSTLLSIKTGGCEEDCGYCPQSVHYDTGVEATKLLDPASGPEGVPEIGHQPLPLVVGQPPAESDLPSDADSQTEDPPFRERGEWPIELASRRGHQLRCNPYVPADLVQLGQREPGRSGRRPPLGSLGLRGLSEDRGDLLLTVPTLVAHDDPRDRNLVHGGPPGRRSAQIQDTQAGEPDQPRCRICPSEGRSRTTY